MLKRYHIRPGVVEAIRFTGGYDSACEIANWIISNNDPAYVKSVSVKPDPCYGPGGRLEIESLDCTIDVPPGYYVVHGPLGHFYTCSGEVFRFRYIGEKD